VKASHPCYDVLIEGDPHPAYQRVKAERLNETLQQEAAQRQAILEPVILDPVWQMRVDVLGGEIHKKANGQECNSMSFFDDCTEACLDGGYWSYYQPPAEISPAT